MISQRALVRATLLTLSGAIAMGADSGSEPSASPFAVAVEKITDGVFVARRPISWRLPVQANVTIVINENDVVLVDGAGLPAHAAEVIAAIRRLTDKPVSTILTTHWHGDHNLANAVYRREYPGVRIVAHENTRNAMADGVMEYALGATEEKIRPGIDYMLQQADEAQASGAPAEVVKFWQGYAQDYEAQLREYMKVELVLADETFSERYVLHRGERTLEFLYLGNANTDGDAILWLPKEKIVATGDIVVLPTPYGFGSYPAEWGATLRAIRQLGFETLVPGHGEVQHGTDYVDKLIRLMDDISAQGRAAIANGAGSEDELRAAIDFSVHEAAIAGKDPLLRFLFNLWFEKPIIRSVFIESTGGTVQQLPE